MFAILIEIGIEFEYVFSNTECSIKNDIPTTFLTYFLLLFRRPIGVVGSLDHYFEVYG